jgi:hypothetical protein
MPFIQPREGLSPCIAKTLKWVANAFILFLIGMTLYQGTITFNELQMTTLQSCMIDSNLYYVHLPKFQFFMIVYGGDIVVTHQVLQIYVLLYYVCLTRI